MFIAELHGRRRNELQNDEDHLTSAVFGHLRYVPPATFWKSLFLAARSDDPVEHFATDEWPRVGYTNLSIEFWPSFSVWGEPDLLLRFDGNDVPTLRVLIEVKLWATKSGIGGQDQLARYQRILDGLPRPHALIYLTPRNAADEIRESLESPLACPHDRTRIYSLQWQDLLNVAEQQATLADDVSNRILRDVARFLRKRGLEYFDGCKHLERVFKLTFPGQAA